MLVFGIVVAYLVVGLVVGGAVARVGYGRDAKVKAHMAEYIKHRDREGRRDSYYFDSAKRNAKEAVEKAKTFWVIWGVVTIFFYPVMIPIAVLGSITYGLYSLAAKGLMYAITPSRAKADELAVAGD